LKAIEMITSPEGLGMSPKRIMVSSEFLKWSKISRWWSKIQTSVSLHSAIDEIRARIMPFSANFPLADLQESLEYWYKKTNLKFLMNM
jgi:23S rRNA (adenine2503-C2)-methyltransferase